MTIKQYITVYIITNGNIFTERNINNNIKIKSYKTIFIRLFIYKTIKH